VKSYDDILRVENSEGNVTVAVKKFNGGAKDRLVVHHRVARITIPSWRILTLKIAIPEGDLRELLEDTLGHKPSRDELKRFKDYLGVDVYEWLRDNAKAFMQSLSE